MPGADWEQMESEILRQHAEDMAHDREDAREVELIALKEQMAREQLMIQQRQVEDLLNRHREAMTEQTDQTVPHFFETWVGEVQEEFEEKKLEEDDSYLDRIGANNG